MSDPNALPRPTPEAERQGRPLDHSLVHGIAWTGAGSWASQLLTWASTLVVARLLAPEDYGLVGMATIYLGLITLLSEFGLGMAVVTLRDLTSEDIAQLNGLAVILGIACFVLSCAAAQPLGRFFRSPQLPAVVMAMSGAFVITGFKIVPFALLTRQLRFKTLALIDAARAITLAASMIGFALLGFRFWTLVIGGLLSTTLSTGAMLVLRPHRFSWPRLSAIRPAMGFSGHIVATRLSWYAYSNADFLVAGRVLGQTALGLYQLGWTIANVPIEKITALVAQVTPAILASVQHDHAALRRYLLRITEGLAIVVFPASLGMALVAPDFVTLVLGDKWRGAIEPLRLLALSAAFRSVTPLLPQVLNVVGQSRLSMKYGVIAAIVLPPAFYAFAKQWGTTGIALAWVLVLPVLTLPAYRRVLQAIELPIRDYGAALWPALSACVPMALAVLAARWAVGTQGPSGPRLGVEVAAGALAYGSTCLLAHGERIRMFYRTLQALRGRTPAVAPTGGNAGAAWVQ